MLFVKSLSLIIALTILLTTASTAEAKNFSSPFVVDISNDLDVKTTIDVTEFVAGKDTWGDREHDWTTQEFNFIGGEWTAQTSERNNDFAKSCLVMKIGESQYVLIPWQFFKSLSIVDGTQLVRLNGGTEYKGTLRTVLTGNAGSENRLYELSGATSITIVQMPHQVTRTPSRTGISKGSQWRALKGKMPGLIVTKPRFVYSRFHVTSGGGFFVENGFNETLVSEQFGLARKGRRDITSATIGDFERISIGGGGKDDFGMPITVKVKDAGSVSGKLAVTPFGLDPLADEYLNRDLKVAGNLSNGCTIVFGVWSGGEALTLERIHTTEQTH